MLSVIILGVVYAWCRGALWYGCSQGTLTEGEEGSEQVTTLH
jgi:hypothetical protein